MSHPEDRHYERKRKLSAFCRDYDGNEAELAALDNYLDARPPFVEPSSLLPREEWQLRIDLIRKIEQVLEPVTDMNTASFCCLVTMPLDTLKFVSTLSMSDLLTEGWSARIDGVAPLIRLFTHGPTKTGPTQADAKGRKRQRIGSSQLAHSSATSPRSSGVSTSPRNRGEAEKCKERDGNLCILTKTTNPEVCHIVPFSWNGEEGRKRFMQCSLSLGLLFQGPHKIGDAFVKDQSQGLADRAWNMLCLSPTLHSWWGKNLFGLKYLGHIPVQIPDDDPSKPTKKMVEVKLQFHWLKKSHHTTAHGTLSHDLRLGFLQQLETQPATPAVASHFPSNRPILTGRTFEVKLNEEDAPKFISAIKVQWAIGQLAAMSGGAENMPNPFGSDTDEETEVESIVEPIDIPSWLCRLRSNSPPQTAPTPPPADPPLPRPARSPPRDASSQAVWRPNPRHGNVGHFPPPPGDDPKAGSSKSPTRLVVDYGGSVSTETKQENVPPSRLQTQHQTTTSPTRGSQGRMPGSPTTLGLQPRDMPARETKHQNAPPSSPLRQGLESEEERSQRSGSQSPRKRQAPRRFQ